MKGQKHARMHINRHMKLGERRITYSNPFVDQINGHFGHVEVNCVKIKCVSSVLCITTMSTRKVLGLIYAFDWTHATKLHMFGVQTRSVDMDLCL